jgi:hypothetical protein
VQRKWRGDDYSSFSGVIASSGKVLVGAIITRNDQAQVNKYGGPTTTTIRFQKLQFSTEKEKISSGYNRCSFSIKNYCYGRRFVFYSNDPLKRHQPEANKDTNNKNNSNKTRTQTKQQ